VPVLEHEQQRLAAGGACKEVGHGRVQAMALGVGIGGDRRRQPADARGQVCKQPRQLAAGAAEVRTEQLRIGGANELIERFGEGAVGRVHHGVAGAVEHVHSFAGNLLRQLAHEAALARSGLPAQQREPAALPLLARNERPQRRELRSAADERIGGGESEGAGKLFHAQMQDASQI
jgi:hypothetical protein